MTIARKEVRFTKMHGAGNDYIYLDATGEDRKSTRLNSSH